MLLKLLVKLIILSLGLYLLNAMFYFGLNDFGLNDGPPSTSELTVIANSKHVIYEFLLNILYFKQINSWFAFSYILSALGFVAFVINDYFQEESLLLDVIKKDLSIIFGTLILIWIFLSVIIIVWYLYLLLIYIPYYFGWGVIFKSSPVTEYFSSKYQIDYSLNFTVYIPAIFFNLFLLKVLFINKQQNRLIDKFSNFKYSILLIYFVFTFPTIWVWLYPTLLLLIENKRLPNTYIIYLVLYSSGLIFIFYKIFKRIKKDRLSKLKAQIKEELIQELK
jgi:hypothetical protein